MDPVQRIITHIAHRLFASIFQKLLTPAADSNDLVSVEDASASSDQIDMTNENGSTTLEQILKHKTFTRSTNVLCFFLVLCVLLKVMF